MVALAADVDDGASIVVAVVVVDDAFVDVDDAVAFAVLDVVALLLGLPDPLMVMLMQLFLLFLLRMLLLLLLNLMLPILRV